MTMGKYLEDERKKSERRIAKDVKLTKEGLKFATLKFDLANNAKSMDIINELFQDRITNYNLWNGLASNPELDGDLLLEMLRKLKEIGDKESIELKKTKQELDDAEEKVKKTKAAGKVSANNLQTVVEKAKEAAKEFFAFEKQVKKAKTDRDIVRKLLAQHPKNHDDTLRKLLFGGKSGGNMHTFQNPNLSTDILNEYFNIRVLPEGADYNKNSRYVFFKPLMKAKNLTSVLVSEWYERLKPFADWSYRNSWYETVTALLDFDDLSENILKDIASAPYNKSPYEFSETFRQKATEHKNATNSVKLVAFRTSQNQKYLPDEARNFFLDF